MTFKPGQFRPQSVQVEMKAGTDVIKLFFLITNGEDNKLERLSFVNLGDKARKPPLEHGTVSQYIMPGAYLLRLGQKTCQSQALKLICPTVSDEEKVLNNIDTTGQCYKTFYSRKLRLSIISWDVCSWQAFQAWSSVCG